MPIITTARPFLPILEWTNSRGKFTYQVTPQDRLTLIRSVWREGRPQGAVAYTLLQRFTFLYPKYRNLSTFIQAYSQPINPRWFPKGDLHLAAIKAVKGEKQSIARLEAKAALRPTFASTPESKIPPRVVNLVDNVLTGRLKSPVPTAVHFRGSKATTSDTETKAKRKAVAFAKKGGFGEIVPINAGYGAKVNWFFSGNNLDKKLFTIRGPNSGTSPIVPQEPRPAVARTDWTFPLALMALGFVLLWYSNDE